MHKLSFNKLYYFYVVAKEGSVKNASKKLHLTQPTISTQIRQFEDEIGYDLFQRKHRKLILTGKGKYLLKNSEKLFSLAEDLLLNIKDEQGERQQFKIGAIQSLSNSFISDFSMGLWKDKKIKVSIAQGSIENLLNKMDNSELHMILTDEPYTKSKRYKSTSLESDQIIAVTSPKMSHLKKDFPKSLNGVPYVAFSNQGRLQQDVDFYFENQNIHINKTGEVDDITLMRVITTNANSFCTLPRRAAKESLKNKELVSIGELKGLKTQLWAITSTLAKDKKMVQKVIQNYFIRKS